MPPVLGPNNEKYEDFYADWTRKQEEMMKELREALESDAKEDELQELIARIEKHYEAYYDAKDKAAHQNVLQVVTPAWRSPLEKALLWLGGWRPSMAFTLVYALAGQQVEDELADFLDGLDTPTLASLSSSQLSRISELQTATIKEEDLLSHDMASLQQSIADQPLLTLAQANLTTGDDQRAENEDGLQNAMTAKLKTLEEISVHADSLRLSTLKKVLGVLNIIQKGQYLVAAGQLQAAVRHIGEKLNGQNATPVLEE